MNKENLVIINSVDRDWFNEDSQNRYSFQVRFNPEPDGKERVPVIENNAIKRVGGAIVYETKEFKGDKVGIQKLYLRILYHLN